MITRIQWKFRSVDKVDHFIPVDINECDNNTLNCSEGCLNLPGSAVCTCPKGFFLENDNKSCSGLC